MLLAILLDHIQFSIFTIDFHTYVVLMALTHMPNSHAQNPLSVLTEISF